RDDLRVREGSTGLPNHERRDPDSLRRPGENEIARFPADLLQQDAAELRSSRPMDSGSPSGDRTRKLLSQLRLDLPQLPVPFTLLEHVIVDVLPLWLLEITSLYSLVTLHLDEPLFML